jgi:hypothetical protein
MKLALWMSAIVVAACGFAPQANATGKSKAENVYCPNSSGQQTQLARQVSPGTRITVTAGHSYDPKLYPPSAYLVCSPNCGQYTLQVNEHADFGSPGQVRITAIGSSAPSGTNVCWVTVDIK